MVIFGLAQSTISIWQKYERERKPEDLLRNAISPNVNCLSNCLGVDMTQPNVLLKENPLKKFVRMKLMQRDEFRDNTEHSQKSSD